MLQRLMIIAALLFVSGCDEMSEMWDDVMGKEKIVLRPKEEPASAPVDDLRRDTIREPLSEPVNAPAPQQQDIAMRPAQPAPSMTSRPQPTSRPPLSAADQPQVNSFGGVVIVDQVGANPSEDALHADDWIIKVNGDPIHCSDDIMDIAAAAFQKSMKPLGVLIQRAGQTIFLDVPLDSITRMSFLDPDSCVSWDK